MSRASRAVVAVACAAGSGLFVAGCGSVSTGSSGGDGTSAAVVGTKVREVRIAGVSSAVLVTRQRSPRGGYQLRLYEVDGVSATQLLDAQGNPIVPVVATDTAPASAVTADCVGAGLQVTTADPGTSAHALRVRRTTYAFDTGHRARVVSSRVTTTPAARAAATLRIVEEHVAFAACPSA